MTPAQQPEVRVTAGASEVELGAAFPLTVVRVWERGHVPEPWSDAALAPLQVRLESSQTRELDGRDGARGASGVPGVIVETRVYTAWAFTLEPIALPELQLRVKPALDPAAPGTVELPGGLLLPPAESGGVRTLVAVGIELLVLAAIAFAFLRHRARHRRDRPAEPAPASPAAAAAADVPAPEERALSRIAQLRRLEPQNHDELQAFHVEASALARDYVDERIGLRASRMTSEQLAESPQAGRALTAEQRSLLARLLLQCDRVKFAGHAPAAAERTHLLDGAESFVRGGAPT